MDFAGKNVVFVAGLGGIGYETSKLLVKKNIANFYVLDIIENQSAVQALQASNTDCKVHYLKFDITDKTSIKTTIATIVGEVKYIDILVNGAGILLESDVEKTIAVNLIGMINTTYEALPYMNKQQHGRGGLVANIASVLGLEPLNVAVSYVSSKFGVVGFTRTMADKFYYDLTGVAFTAICPGLVDTPLKNNVINSYTFDYSKPEIEKVLKVKTQTAITCAEHFITVIETNKNGSMWISDCGTLTEVIPKIYWTPVMT